MDYSRYGRVAPTTTGEGSRPPLSSFSSNQSYFIGQSLPERRGLPHMPVAHLGVAPTTTGGSSRPPLSSNQSYSIAKTLPESRALPHMQGTHLGASGARGILSPYHVSLQFPQVVPGPSGRVNGFSQPMGRSIREPTGVPLWDPMRAGEPKHHQEVPRRGLIRRDHEVEWVPRRELIRRDHEVEFFLREQDRLSSHAPFYQHRPRPQPQQIIARNIDKITSSTARIAAQPQRITMPLERGDRLATYRPRDSQQIQNLQVHRKKQGLKHGSKKRTAKGLQPKLTERSQSDILTRQNDNAPKVLGAPLDHESKKKPAQGLLPKLTERSQSDIPTTQNDNAPKILGSPGWCSLCNVDCGTKEVLHKYHVNGKKHQSKLKKLLVSGDGKMSVHKEVQDIDSSIAKRKRHMNEDGSLSSPKRQKLSILSLDCKICNKEFSSQVVLESHLSGKKHASQLKKLGNSAASLEVNGDQSKKSVGVDGKQSEISKLVVVAENDAEAAGGEEEKTVLKANENAAEAAGGEEEKTILKANDDREIRDKSEEDDSKESAEPCEVGGKINNSPRGRVEDVAVTTNVKVKVES